MPYVVFHSLGEDLVLFDIQVGASGDSFRAALIHPIAALSAAEKAFIWLSAVIAKANGDLLLPLLMRSGIPNFLCRLIARHAVLPYEHRDMRPLTKARPRL